MCVLQETPGKRGPEGQPCVGIFSINRPENFKILYSIFSQRFIACPLYDTHGSNTIKFILDQSETTVVCAEASKMKVLLEGRGAALKYIVILDENLDDEEKSVLEKQAKDAKITLFTIKDLRESADKTPGETSDITPDDWAYIMYTSGTTGNPKGVCLTHKNILSAASGVMRQSPRYEGAGAAAATGAGAGAGAGAGDGDGDDGCIGDDGGDIYISYLPMAHSFEICIQICMVAVGASIGFFQGDIRLLVSSDLPLLKPTLMSGVPRVYGRVYDKVMQQVEEKGPVAKLLFDTAFANQAWCMEMGFRNPLWDLLVFNKIKEALGGRVRLMASGAAPLGTEVHKFMRTVFGVPICQGYGMTENAAAAVCQPPEYSATGNVGGPVPCTEVKLEDTEYYKTTDEYPKTAQEFEEQFGFKGEFDPSLAGKRMVRGEVCLRGNNVFLGYYKMEEETKEVLDKDGWLHTGDIGMWNEDGSLSIIDRKKNIFKLAQGEYVAPEVVESAISTCKWVSQVFVYGNSFENHLIAIIVPSEEVLSKHAEHCGWTADNGGKISLADIVAKPEVAKIMKKQIMDDIVASCKSNKLRGFEVPKAIDFEAQVNDMGYGFTIENDCLTPTMKLRRPQLEKRYAAMIKKLYDTIKAEAA
ncbi:hypothetical protein GUITHDRAFT_121866 [Guillardia theta CCMP2712]|uniref:AMP-dependent synthetase/ligase domain-containing protein n=1 Tax=Guillardia theta (strain CCMP2712) TaxID=905079 RepID=L1I7T4_GUITC|nr:hypothetical protein GUITHDRAFT_121866 [Guillardia theta CCMP2712]EKX31964.1 hypothetical protein GUITHDRAFT_121866 [Guillardia theta CCMP2712]|eukprot:XP_005818944.1 hypothetical protein GUITHDRAFT_121866 [Guillardia theta CCMP2712]